MKNQTVTLMSSIQKLLQISADIRTCEHASQAPNLPGGIPTGLMAFEGALWCFVDDSGDPFGKQAVNGGSWKSSYADSLSAVEFFAADAFGCMWGVQNGAVVHYNAETVELTPYAPSFDYWAERVLGDWKVETGWPLISEWQNKHGALPYGSRLAPKIPFVLGGQYSLENLFSQTLPDRLDFGAYLAKQIADLPDGAKVRLVTTD